MATVVADMSVSLDGFVADPSDGVEGVFAWYGKPQPEPAAGGQCLDLGLVDRIQVKLVPLLLGNGIRLFGTLAVPIELENPEVTEGNGVTHMYYNVLKRAV
jgi:hypothetical protein